MASRRKFCEKTLANMMSEDLKLKFRVFFPLQLFLLVYDFLMSTECGDVKGASIYHMKVWSNFLIRELYGKGVHASCMFSLHPVSLVQAAAQRFKKEIFAIIVNYCSKSLPSDIFTGVLVTPLELFQGLFLFNSLKIVCFNDFFEQKIIEN